MTMSGRIAWHCLVGRFAVHPEKSPCLPNKGKLDRRHARTAVFESAMGGAIARIRRLEVCHRRMAGVSFIMLSLG